MWFLAGVGGKMDRLGTDWSIHWVLCMILRSRGVGGAHWGNLGKDFIMFYQKWELLNPQHVDREKHRWHLESFHMARPTLGGWNAAIELSQKLWHWVYGRTPAKTLILKRRLRHSASVKTQEVATRMEVRAGLHGRSQEGLFATEIKIVWGISMRIRVSPPGQVSGNNGVLSNGCKPLLLGPGISKGI